jgi:hypothetical protein
LREHLTGMSGWPRHPSVFQEWRDGKSAGQHLWCSDYKLLLPFHCIHTLWKARPLWNYFLNFLFIVPQTHDFREGSTVPMYYWYSLCYMSTLCLCTCLKMLKGWTFFWTTLNSHSQRVQMGYIWPRMTFVPAVVRIPFCIIFIWWKTDCPTWLGVLSNKFEISILINVIYASF